MRSFWFTLQATVPSFWHVSLMGDRLNQETTTTTHSVLYYWRRFACPMWCDYCYAALQTRTLRLWGNPHKVMTFSADTQSWVLWLQMPHMLLPSSNPGSAPKATAPGSQALAHKPWRLCSPVPWQQAQNSFQGSVPDSPATLKATGSWQAEWNRLATPAEASSISLNGLGQVLIFPLRLRHHCMYSLRMMRKMSGQWTEGKGWASSRGQKEGCSKSH